MKIFSDSIWPKIATTEIKHRCLNEFKEAMSNHVVDRTVCAVCACLHYKLETCEINIAKFQIKLYYVQQMKCLCVLIV